MSQIINPLSASIRSPDLKTSRIPLLAMMALSETDPGYNLLHAVIQYVITAFSATPSKILNEGMPLCASEGPLRLE